jgi:hypothetical protein
MTGWITCAAWSAHPIRDFPIADDTGFGLDDQIGDIAPGSAQGQGAEIGNPHALYSCRGRALHRFKVINKHFFYTPVNAILDSNHLLFTAR